MNENKKIHIIFGGLIGIGVFFGLVLLFAGIIMMFGIDRIYSAVFATIAVATGGFFSAYYTASKWGEKGYLIGLIAGTIYFLLIGIVSVIVSKSKISYNTLFHFLIIVLASVIGGISGVSKKKTKLL